MRSFLKSQSMDCMACISSELASAEACMLASAAEFRLASMGCWSAAVTTEVLLPATRLAWYTVAAGASSEPPVASSWAPIGAEGPWSPSDEATLTASSFSGGPKTALPRLPPPSPPSPSPPLPKRDRGTRFHGRRWCRRYRPSPAVHDVARGAWRASSVHSAARQLSCYCLASDIARLTLFRGTAHSTFMSFPSRSLSPYAVRHTRVLIIITLAQYIILYLSV